MAITFVKSTEIRWDNADSGSASVASTAGNQLIACIAAYNAVGFPTSMTVSGGGTWVSNFVGTSGANMGCFFCSCKSATGGTNTITITRGGGSPGATSVAAFIYELSGLENTGTLYEGGGTTNSGTSTTPATNALTNTAVNAVKVAITSVDGGNNTSGSSTGTGWTIPTNGQEPDGTAWLIAMSAYKIVSASQSDTESWSRTPSNPWRADIATYIAAAVQDTPELYGRPDGRLGSMQLMQILAQ